VPEVRRQGLTTARPARSSLKARVLLLLVLAALLPGACATGPATAGRETAGGEARNVIFLLSDGTGPEGWPLARWVKGAPLAVDDILAGAVRTYGADSLITDSAPGATAFATGHKGSDKGISVGAWNTTIMAVRPEPELKYVPLATLLEGARLSGRAVGLVATSNVQHATPAAFSSHWHDRNNYNELGEQQVYQGMEVVLSGGRQYLLPKGVQGGKREDNENLLEVLQARGYALVTTREELARIGSGKVWGAFAPDAMAYELDRARTAPQEPSLAEMTAKAIQLLAGSAKGRQRGFFLFVEGSKVDWAAHANDPAGLVGDLLAFDEAVDAALQFARQRDDTLVVAVADHGTGGLSIGTREDKNYSQTDDDSVLPPLRRARLSGEGVEKLLAGDASEQAVRELLAREWGIKDLSAAELKAIQEAIIGKKQLQSVVGPMLSTRARLGWTTGGHTGADVFLFSYGPGRPTGLWENTDVGRRLAAGMGFDFESLNRRLFVEAGEGLAAAGLSSRLDKSDPANPVLVAAKGAAEARLPLAKNLLLLNGKEVELEGVVVYAEKLDKVFVPRQAIELIAAGL
jgi:alkaline phosphatase